MFRPVASDPVISRLVAALAVMLRGHAQLSAKRWPCPAAGRVRNAKDTGLRNLPPRGYGQNVAPGV